MYPSSARAAEKEFLLDIHPPNFFIQPATCRQAGTESRTTPDRSIYECPPNRLPLFCSFALLLKMLSNSSL
jgi:hypothetical protein